MCPPPHKPKWCGLPAGVLWGGLLVLTLLLAGAAHAIPPKSADCAATVPGPDRRTAEGTAKPTTGSHPSLGRRDAHPAEVAFRGGTGWSVRACGRDTAAGLAPWVGDGGPSFVPPMGRRVHPVGIGPPTSSTPLHVLFCVWLN